MDTMYITQSKHGNYEKTIVMKDTNGKDVSIWVRMQSGAVSMSIQEAMTLICDLGAAVKDAQKVATDILEGK